jgi:trehalose synthase-fused probable maltokinase
VRAQVDASLGALRAVVRDLAPPVAAVAREVLGGRDELLDLLRGLAEGEASGWKTRIHGDYHLGQVLRTGDDFAILDFEGEPLRPPEERRRPHSPWKDVVGMIRSFDYAANAVLLDLGCDDPAAPERLAPWAAAWRSWMSATFLRRYLETVGDAAFVPHAATRSALFRAFLLEKAAYELQYELNHRPHWVPIPLRGIRSLLERTEPVPLEFPTDS